MQLQVAAPAAVSRIQSDVRALGLAMAALGALFVPLLISSPAHLTSDESLYLAEAYSIAHGEGFTYPSGEPITHRAPLYPLALAGPIRAFGPDAAYAVSKAVVIVNAALVMLLAWRLGGQLAGLAAGLSAAASAYLAELGTTLYLDPMQCTFLLLTFWALFEALTSRRLLLYGAAGISLGLAFLAKESAIQWAPLAVVATLAIPSLRDRTGVRGAAVFTVSFAAAIAPWWIWVYAQTGELFLLGEPRTAMIALPVAVLVLGLGGLAVARWRRPPKSLALPAAIAMTILWGGFLVYGLTAFSTWPYPNDYLSTVPRYMLQVAPQMQPFFLIVVAWGVVAWQAVRGDERARLLVVAAALFTPFAIVAANRWLQLRDALPLVYLSYVALGVGAGTAWAACRRFLEEGGAAVPILFAATAAAAVGFATHEYLVFDRAQVREASAREQAGSWDSPYTRDTADWMEANVPDGAHVLTSRLYFSGLHVQTEGRYRIDQLPTVRVSIDGAQEPLIQARSNLFRWGEPDLRRTTAEDTWLNLQQFPGKSYWVGLNQHELLSYIGARQIDYVVLTGDDVAFSSNSYAAYFTGHPAFELLGTIEGTGSDRMFAYRVDRLQLQSITHATTINPRDAAALVAELGMPLDEIERRLGTPLRVTDVDDGLSAREVEAVLAGDDLAP
jgi:4-amino-4-deoxy-L-arabinose transferase-like glycosyltransferase